MADPPASGAEDTAVAATQPSDGGTGAGEPAAAPATKMRVVGAGDSLGRYTLDEEVGEGGMATVFRARDRELRREVAIKVLFPHLARRDEVVRRFQREARSAASLEHPNILRIFDVGGGAGDAASGDPPFIVMELIRGRSLLAEIEQRAPILAEVAACIGALLADALGAAHAAGIVHRDVKPANVLVDPGTPASAGALHPRPGGRLLLADFGVARLETEDSLVTKTGAVLGTPAYMSPEQATGDTSTRKSDLYSLGATLYQLATGSLPYSGSPAKVLSAIATGSFVPAVRRRASVGGDLSRVIDRLMAVEPSARPADAATVAAELRAIAVAGGLGDPTAELAAYFADPDAFLRARTPVVVTALVHAAQRAVGDSKLPRAMALADRASALAPDDPIVTALVSTVTEGGRASSRRRVALVAVAGIAAAGGAAFGVHALVARGGGGDLPIARADAAPAIAIAAPVDAAAAEPDAAAAIVASMPVDASAPRARPDASGPRPRADAAAAAAVDAAAAAPDAPEPLADAAAASAPADGKIAITTDTWCELFLDDRSFGRLAPPYQKTLDHVPAGHHTVRCEQTDHAHSWQQQVDVAPGATIAASGRLLPALTVTVKTRVDLRIDGAVARRGTLVHLTHGDHRFEYDGGHVQHLDISSDCTLVTEDEDRGSTLLACVPSR